MPEQWRWIDANREIIRVIHGNGDPVECHESAYLDVQTMINGILNIDRSIPGQDKNYYRYFSTNFKGSLRSTTGISLHWLSDQWSIL